MKVLSQEPGYCPLCVRYEAGSVCTECGTTLVRQATIMRLPAVKNEYCASCQCGKHGDYCPHCNGNFLNYPAMRGGELPSHC